MLSEKRIKTYNSISFLLICTYSIIISLIFILIFIFSYYKIARYLSDKLDESLVEEVKELKGILQKNGTSAFFNAAQLEAYSDKQNDKFVRIFDKEQQMVKSYIPECWKNTDFNRDCLSKAKNDNMVFETINIPLRGQKVRILYVSLNSDYKIQMGVSTADDDNLLKLLKNRFREYLVLIIPASVFISWLMAKLVLKDINALNRTVVGIKAGNINLRMPVSRHANEITELATAFNSMLDYLQELLSTQKEVSDNIAHDLRSPLTRICGEIEVILTKPRRSEEYVNTLESIMEDIREMQTMINTMLDIASMEADVSANKKEVDLKILLNDVVDLFQYAAEEKNCSLQLECPESIILLLSPECMKRALSNLLDNSIKYTPPKGTISIKAEKSNNSIEITVSDTGIGIDEKELKNIFRRFYRTENSRTSSGNGLGLCLVESIVKAHYGEIRVNSIKNRGTAFTIKLPY